MNLAGHLAAFECGSATHSTCGKVLEQVEQTRGSGLRRRRQHRACKPHWLAAEHRASQRDRLLFAHRLAPRNLLRKLTNERYARAPVRRKDRNLTLSRNARLSQLVARLRTRTEIYASASSA